VKKKADIDLNSLARYISVTSMAGGILTYAANKVGDLLEEELVTAQEDPDVDPVHIKLITAAMMYVDQISEKCTEAFLKYDKVTGILASEDVYGEDFDELMTKTSKENVKNMNNVFKDTKVEVVNDKDDLSDFDFDLVKKITKTEKPN
jgi:hypothetical protein